MPSSPKGALCAVRMAPVSAAIAAPTATVSAPDRPEALPASVGRTDMAPEPALGMVMPLPMPTHMQAPNRVSSCTTPHARTSSPRIKPRQATMRPPSIMAVSECRAARRPER